MLTERQENALNAIPKDKIFIMHPFASWAKVLQTEIIADIERILPEARIYKLGSLELKIGGQNDVDLIVVDADYVRAKSICANRFGTPTYEETYATNWKFPYKGFPIGITLRQELPREFLEVLEILGNDESLLQEYIDLKTRSNGLPFRDYLRKKLLFYNSILVLKRDVSVVPRPLAGQVKSQPMTFGLHWMHETES